MRARELSDIYCSIYKITNTCNDKVYIGQTWAPINERWKQHLYPDNGCIKLAFAIIKYKEESFKIELLTVTNTQVIADFWEGYFITKFDSIKNGYNLRHGGSKGKWSQESKDKVRKSNMGHIVTEETRKKLSIAHTGKIITEEHRKNMSIAQTGRKHSEETKLKITGENSKISKLNNILSQEIRNLYLTENYTSRQLAKQFSVGKTTILRIINNKSWRLK